jgi:spore germination protein
MFSIIQLTVTLLLCMLIKPSTCTNTEILVYYADYLHDEATPSLNSELSHFTHISFDYFVTNKKGGIIGTAPADVISQITTAGKKSYLCISNYGKNDFSGSMAHAILTSSRIQNRLMNGLIAKMTSLQFNGGINVDFEAIPHGDRNKFTSFLTQLKQRLASLNSNPYKLVVSIPAMDGDYPQDSWVGAYDLPTLGSTDVIDIAQIMTYDEHGPWSKPGPISSINFFTTSMNYALQHFSASKVSMGIPAYGYDWDLTAGTADTIPLRNIDGLLSDPHTKNVVKKWSDEFMSPSFTYTDGKGHKHEVWYENVQSVQAKAKAAKAKGTGISVWALGLEDSTFWQAIYNA